MNQISVMGPGVFIFVGVFLGILMLFDGISQLVSRTERPQDARNRRMRLISSGASTEQLLAILKPKAEPWNLKSLPGLGTLPRDLNQAGMRIRPATVLGLCALTAVVSGLALSSRMGPGIAFAVAGAVSFGLPLLIIRNRREARMKLLVSQLPDALDLMSRGLRVGHPLNTTISTVARDMVDPIASEFGLIVDQISYGDDLVSAFRDFSDRTGLEDVAYLATGVAIQNGTGGDLAGILMTLAKVIRGRILMRKRILAISSEGRLTAWFMSLLPLFIIGSTSISSPNYYAGVSDDPMFRPIAVIIVCLIVANFVVMRRLVNFKI